MTHVQPENNLNSMDKVQHSVTRHGSYLISDNNDLAKKSGSESDICLVI
jgi:hypothetical protein